MKSCRINESPREGKLSFNIFASQINYLKRLLQLVLLLSCTCGLFAQAPADSVRPALPDSLLVTDTLQMADSLVVPDSARLRVLNDSLLQNFQPSANLNKFDVFFNLPIDWRFYIIKPAAVSEKVLKPFSPLRETEDKDFLFYVLVFLFLVYALIRNSFPKYFSDLFRLFFRTTLKQRQIREQMMQTPLPSLLYNGLFVLSAGLYLAFIAQYFKLDKYTDFWLIYIYSCAGLSVVYFIKFLGLLFTGWLFQQQEGARSYIFIVFIVNKMIGILLLPFLLVLAFSGGNIYTVGLNLSAFMLGGLLLYRFILTYGVVRNQVRVNPFHFFLYLCAFEIAPLFLIYKGLLLIFQQSA